MFRTSDLKRRFGLFERSDIAKLSDDDSPVVSRYGVLWFPGFGLYVHKLVGVDDPIYHEPAQTAVGVVVKGSWNERRAWRRQRTGMPTVRGLAHCRVGMPIVRRKWRTLSYVDSIGTSPSWSVWVAVGRKDPHWHFVTDAGVRYHHDEMPAAYRR